MFHLSGTGAGQGVAAQPASDVAYLLQILSFLDIQLFFSPQHWISSFLFPQQGQGKAAQQMLETGAARGQVSTLTPGSQPPEPYQP